MAYGNKYYSGWHSNSKKGYLYIDKLDYVGAATPLTLKRDGFAISTNLEDMVMGITAEFSLMNLESDFFALLDLMTLKEREFKVRIVTIHPSSLLLFEGFLNCDITSQKYLKRQSINFVASSYISKLTNVHPTILETLQNVHFIDIIDEILRQSGAEFNIRVNSKLKAEGDTFTSTQTLFDKNGFFTELFWEDEDKKEYKSSLDVLRSILISFNCFIYWHNGYWYIERYSDIWEASVTYVEYGIRTGFTGTQTSVVVANTTINTHDFVWMNTSQTLSVVPELKTIKITLDDKRFSNLTINDFSDITDGTLEGTPALRTWEISDLLWDNAGDPHSVISNAILRRPGSSWTPYALNSGIKTTFRNTVVSEDTSINIQFTYIVSSTFPENIWKFKEYTFRFYYYLRTPDMDFVIGNEVEDEGEIYRLEYGTNSLPMLQYVDVSGDSFDLPTKSTNVEITIPVGMIERYDRLNPEIYLGKLTGDQTFTLCLCAVTMFLTNPTDEQIQWEIDTFPYDYDENVPLEFQVQWAYFGDVFITETGTIQDNIIEGTIANNFINKEDISLELYDANSFSYKNAILRGADLEHRTERWGVADASIVTINQRGVCYSVTSNPPTLSDPYTINGTGFGSFISKITGLLSNTLYRVRAYAIDSNANVIYATTPAGGTLPFTTLGLSVGDKYGGGTIGYIFQPGDVGYVAGQVHGMIVSDYQYQGKIGVTSGGGPYTSDANRDLIGGGFANTEGILANPRQSQQGISKLVTYRLNNYFDDWYLPDYDELRTLWVNRVLIGGFANWYYWTSTEPYDWNQAWKYAFAINFGSPTAPASTCAPNTKLRSAYFWEKTHSDFYFRFVRNF